MEITKVRVRHADRSIWGHLAEREKTLPLVTPLDIYADFQETRGSWFWESGMALVEIETDEGIIGRGWCEDGCRAVAPVIENHLFVCSPDRIRSKSKASTIDCTAALCHTAAKA